MKALLALDLGTTGVRALAFDEQARTLARAYRPLGSSYPVPGWVEQDPEALVAQSLEVLRAALAQAKLGARDVAALGLVTQRATVIAWDKETKRALAPALSWADQRTRPRVAELRALGLPMTTLASATKIEWWMRNDPEIARAARAGRLRIGTPDAWLTARLAGADVFVSEPGHASCTALFLPGERDFSDGLCGLFSVPRDVLPRIVATNEVVGETRRELLGAAIPLAARAGDQQASAFGQGVHAPGNAKLTLGTSAMLDVHAGSAPPAAGPGAYPLALWALASGERAFCREGTVISAGAAFEWLAELGLAREAGALVKLAESARESSGVVFVPALLGLGTPHQRDDARGLFLGLTRGTQRGALAHAVLEGVALRCAQVFEALAVGGERSAPLRVDGGLAQSDLLLEMIADLIDLPLLRSLQVEATALGAALLAGLGIGFWPTAADTRALLPEATRFAPGPAQDLRRARRAPFERAAKLA